MKNLLLLFLMFVCMPVLGSDVECFSRTTSPILQIASPTKRLNEKFTAKSLALSNSSNNLFDAMSHDIEGDFWSEVIVAQQRSTTTENSVTPKTEMYNQLFMMAFDLTTLEQLNRWRLLVVEKYKIFSEEQLVALEKLRDETRRKIVLRFLDV